MDNANANSWIPSLREPERQWVRDGRVNANIIARIFAATCGLLDAIDEACGYKEYAGQIVAA